MYQKPNKIDTAALFSKMVKSLSGREFVADYRYIHTVLQSLIQRYHTNKSSLARYLGVDRETVYRWLAGDTEPRPSQLAQIANYYKLGSMNEFFEPPQEEKDETKMRMLKLQIKLLSQRLDRLEHMRL